MTNIEIRDLDISINKGELIGIIGQNGCGKTNLLKKMIGRENNTDIYIDNKCISEYDIIYKRNNIVCVFNDNIFQTNKPKFELQYYISLLKDREDYDRAIKDFIQYFNLDSILDIEFDELSIENRVYVKILSLLIINPTIICIDDLLSYLKIEKKSKIINYIKEKDIILFNVTSDMEELMLFDKILILNKGKKELFDDTMKVLEQEKIFNELGLKLPFIFDINNMLESYELIDKKHLVSKELVDILWK